MWRKASKSCDLVGRRTNRETEGSRQDPGSRIDADPRYAEKIISRRTPFMLRPQQALNFLIKFFDPCVQLLYMRFNTTINTRDNV